MYTNVLIIPFVLERFKRIHIAMFVYIIEFVMLFMIYDMYISALYNMLFAETLIGSVIECSIFSWRSI